MTNRQIYEIGLKKIKDDKIYELKSKIARVKDSIIYSLNEPMDLKEFELLANELIDYKKELECLKK
ncbi:hypothetical protein F1B92_03940 [Campylobacter sp. FMV-PI01]|uniref:Uncharacterized protein n=1 Tax=Campylobacter portucalensis TaxID=2608384 RepID=A0A6L5WGN6_9BACT|nr:hypothetical protein [Campylobacter portucalensis]MSN96348.1 hypothetical protein [Campylobacter portucalensis]